MRVDVADAPNSPSLADVLDHTRASRHRWPPLHRLLASVALAQGDAEEAVRLLEAAIDTLRASRSENELGLALGALGRAKRLMGNDVEATAIVQEALAILDRLGTLEEPDRLRHELAAEPVRRT